MISFELYDDLFEPVVVLNEKAEILYYNSSFLALFKVTPRNLLKTNSLVHFLNEYDLDLASFVKNFISTGQSLSPEITFKKLDQEQTVVMKGTKLFDKYIIMLKDITVEKQLYDKYKISISELKNSHEQIVQIDKLKALGEMSANISHEINNPLTVAYGNNEILSFSLDNKDLNQERENILLCQQNIESSLERIKKIISNMKDFLYKNEELKEYVGIHSIIQASIDLLNPKIKAHHISIQFSSSDQDYIVMANRVKIEQVIVNLIQNAIDAMVDAKVEKPTITISLNSEENTSFVQLRIADNGPGIKPEDKEKVFQTFYTTKEIGKGTGLGLSISNRIIESHQGKLKLIDSKLGATFEITLPSTALSNYIQGDWSKILNSDGNSIKVLIVDNEPQILNLCMSFLKDGPYLFLGATSGKEALEILERTDINLVITDLNMPDQNGISLLKELRDKNYQGPALLLSSREGIQTYTEHKDEHQISGILLKPFNKEELNKIIDHTINNNKK